MPQIVGSPWGDVPFPDDMSEEEIDRQMLEYAKAQHSMGNVSATRSLSSSYDNPMRARVPPPPPPPSNTGPTGIDFNQDEALVRQQIQMIPDEATRVREMNAWQDYVVKQTHDQAANIPRTGNPFKDIASGAGGLAQTGLLIDDTVRAGARGVPFVAPFMDELAAKTSGGGEENTAYQHARDRYFDREAPIQSGIAQMAGGTAASLGAAGAIRAGLERFAPQIPAWLARLSPVEQTGVAAGTGAVSGVSQQAAISAGNAQGGVGPRLAAVAENVPALAAGAILGGAGGAAGPAMQEGIRRKYPTPQVDTGMTAALQRQGINELPYFARSNDPAIQDLGRKLAQRPTRLGHDLASAYDTGVEAVSDRASDVVRRTTGTTPPTAPYVAGTDVIGEAARPAANPPTAATGLAARQAQMDRLKNTAGTQIRTLLPDDANQVNVLGANTGRIAERIRNDRLASRATRSRANRGLGQARRLSEAGFNREQTWPGFLDARTTQGEKIDIPFVTSGKTRTSETLARRLYGPMTEDLQATANAAGVGDRFTQLNARYRALSDTQRELAQVIGQSKDAEGLIRKMAASATADRTGTAIADLERVVQFLRPDLQERLGGGVLGHIVNSASGNPTGIATRLAAIPDENKALLFPGGGARQGPGTGLRSDVQDLQDIGTRLAPIDRHRINASGALPDNAINPAAALTDPVKAGLAVAAGGPAGLAAMLGARAVEETAKRVTSGRRRMQLIHGDMSPSIRRAGTAGKGIAATVGAAARTGRDRFDEYTGKKK